MTDHRRRTLSDLAEYTARLFHTSHITRLETIVALEGLQVIHDSYEKAFDGILVVDEGNWYIHIDNDGGNGAGSRKGRFTLAHELAHFIISEHKFGIANGEFLHGSKFDVSPSDPREIEANHFAASLLMPTNLFRSTNTSRKFSIDTIFTLSNTFQVSFVSAALRFCEIGTHSVCIIFSENNRMKWFARSEDFPKWAFRCKVGETLPPTTVAAEFFSSGNKKYTAPEEVNPSVWFYDKWSVGGRMLEQCYYSDSYGYVISVIWFDK